MRANFLSSWRWRVVEWLTALAFTLLFAYTVVQLYRALTGGSV